MGRTPKTPPGHVRPLESKDLESIAALRQRCFRLGRHQDLGALTKQLQTVFLDNPWRDHGVESLVFETPEGTILGFGGMIGRPMRMCGEPLLAAVSSQTMVDPEARQQGIALAILRNCLDGPQDLLFADQANAAFSHLLETLGGVTIKEIGLQWCYPLRPLRWSAGLLDKAPALKWSLRFARPILHGLDYLSARATRSKHTPPKNYQEEPLTTEQLFARLGGVIEHYDLAPEYNLKGLEWAISLLGQGFSSKEHLEARRVVGPEGETRGFFLAIINPGRVTTAVQFWATFSGFEDTMSELLNIARENQCLAVKGRLQPEFMTNFATAPGSLSVSPNRVTLVTTRPDLLTCIREGRAWLTYLDGEMPMGF